MTTAFNFGSGIHGGMANFCDYYEYDASIGDLYVSNPAVPYLGRTTAAGNYQPNAWGLYDMHGNVWEWCRDWYGNYPTGSVTDPQGPGSGSNYVFRGGGWDGGGGRCRSTFRNYDSPSYRGDDIGFRVVLAPGQPRQGRQAELPGAGEAERGTSGAWWEDAAEPGKVLEKESAELEKEAERLARRGQEYACEYREG